MKVLCFGIAKDIVGTSELNIKIEDASTVIQLKDHLNATFPKLLEYKSYMVAINQVYATDDMSLAENDEVALIPPVSGG